MATYSELRTFIFTALDKNPSTTGDTLTAVNEAIKLVVDELAYDLRPLELFSVSAAVNVTSATTSIALGGGGFLVSNLGNVHAIGVDKKATATPDILLYQELSYEAYIGANNREFGNMRGPNFWTLTPSNTFVLGEWPSGSDTWDVYLYYYRLPAALSDGGEPELPKQHHRAVALMTITMFPQFFGGDRAELFLKFQREADKAKQRALSNRRSMRAVKELRPASSYRGQRDINWSGDTDP